MDGASRIGKSTAALFEVFSFLSEIDLLKLQNINSRYYRQVLPRIMHVIPIPLTFAYGFQYNEEKYEKFKL